MGCPARQALSIPLLPCTRGRRLSLPALHPSKDTHRTSKASPRTNDAAWRAEQALVTIVEIAEAAQTTYDVSVASTAGRCRHPVIAPRCLRHGPTFMSTDGA